MVRVDFPIYLKHWKEPSQIVEKEKCQREDIPIAKNYTVHMSVIKCLHTYALLEPLFCTKSMNYILAGCMDKGRSKKKEKLVDNAQMS